MLSLMIAVVASAGALVFALVVAKSVIAVKEPWFGPWAEQWDAHGHPKRRRRSEDLQLRQDFNVMGHGVEIRGVGPGRDSSLRSE